MAEKAESISIRAHYERDGAETFYRQHGADYRNPHEAIVAQCLRRFVEKFKPDLSHVLDLAAGSGEATLALRAVGAKCIDGIDPYTADAYRARTGQAAEVLSFEQIAAGALAGRTYSLIVCSFAMHLCEASRLPGLAYELSQVSEGLLILSPHKRPILKPQWGWELVHEDLFERVRTRWHRRRAIEGV